MGDKSGDIDNPISSTEGKKREMKKLTKRMTEKHNVRCIGLIVRVITIMITSTHYYYVFNVFVYF